MLQRLFANFRWAPQVDTQNTGRAIYMRPQGPSKVSLDGAGGHAYNQSLSPFNPATTNKRNVRMASVTGTGNASNTDPKLRPLNDEVDPTRNMIGNNGFIQL